MEALYIPVHFIRKQFESFEVGSEVEEGVEDGVSHEHRREAKKKK